MSQQHKNVIAETFPTPANLVLKNLNLT